MAIIQSLTPFKDQIDDFCRRWKVAELAMTESSHRSKAELGLFVRFDPSAEWTLPDRIKMEAEFCALSGLEVSLQSRHADALLKKHPNPMRLLYNA